MPTPAVRGTVGAPVSSLPGSRRLCSTGPQYLLGAEVSWLRQVRVTLVAARHFALLLLLCVCVCVCVCDSFSTSFSLQLFVLSPSSQHTLSLSSPADILNGLDARLSVHV